MTVPASRLFPVWACLYLLFAGAVRAEDTPAAGGKAEEVKAADRPAPPEVDLPFPVGEKLTYTIYWGWIAVGESVATTEWVWRDGAWKLRIRFRTRSNKVLSTLYPVDDTIETFLHGETLLPEIFLVDIHEGGHVRKERTEFDWEAMEARYTRFREEKDDEKKTLELKEGTRDLVSFMYFMRETPFEGGESYTYEVMTEGKLYALIVHAGGKEKVKLDPLGKVESRRLDPEAKFEGVFVRKGKLSVWVSDHERQILTKVKAETPFANVRLLLKTVEGPGGGFLGGRRSVGNR